MRDTPRSVEALYTRMLLRRTGEERLRMGCSMFDAARTVMRASLLAGGITEPVEMRVGLLWRTYGGELEADVLDKVAARLAR